MLDGDVEGHDPSMRKISTTYDPGTEKRHFPTSPPIEEQKPTTHVFDDNVNDDVMASNDDVAVVCNDVFEENQTLDSQQEQEMKNESPPEKDAGAEEVDDTKMNDSVSLLSKQEVKKTSFFKKKRQKSTQRI